MSQMIEMHSADHCVVVAELATSLKDVKFSKQRPDIHWYVIYTVGPPP